MKALIYKAFRVARLEGFEPPAFRIGICCDIQLRHRRINGMCLPKRIIAHPVNNCKCFY